MTRSISLEVITNTAQPEPQTAQDPAQWHQAVGIARQACARIFRDGGKPADAIRAFGLDQAPASVSDWSKAVAAIAESLCTIRIKRAA